MTLILSLSILRSRINFSVTTEKASLTSNRSTSSTIIDLFSDHALPQTPFPFGILTQAAGPWNAFNINDEIVYVLDIDHDQKNAFNKIDEMNLKTINKLIVPIL